MLTRRSSLQLIFYFMYAIILLKVTNAGRKHRQEYHLRQPHSNLLWNVSGFVLSHQSQRFMLASSVDHIDKIIFYLRSNSNFKKYNKFIYAFRLEQATNETFIT